MARRRLFVGMSILAAASAALMGVSSGPAAVAAPGPRPVPLGKPFRLPAHAKSTRHLASFASAPSTAAQRSLGAAAARAAALGRPVTVGAMTTGTITVTVDRHGLFTERSYALPVRVRHGGRWVPVDTSLRSSGSRLAPVAVPGDSVSFSAGGTGPMVVIATGSARLEFWWPGVLPAPQVRGPSATYRDVLPGVSLVLTATSAATGGFKEVLVVGSASAAARLRSIALRVTGRGTHLTGTAAGGLLAPITGGRGYFVAAPPVMWDTPLPASAVTAPARAHAARLAGAGGAGPWGRPPGTPALAPPWSPSASSPDGPGRGAMIGPVRARVAAGGSVLALLPDARLLASPAVRYPVYIDPTLYLQGNGGGNEQAYDPVQSGSGCTGSHFDSSSYSDSPVGYDNFGQGQCQFQDTDRALYRLGLNEVIEESGIHLVSAVVNAKVAYSSSCGVSSTDTLSWIGGINSDTGWPGPNKTSNDTDVTATFPPDTGGNNGTGTDSCSGTFVQNDTATVANGFNVFNDISDITGSSFTIRLSQTGSESSDDTYHEQFTNNPKLVVQFFYSPSTPSTSSMQVSSSSAGSNPEACATMPGSAPAVQVSSSTGGAWVTATLVDPDHESALIGNVKYWQNSNPSNGGTLTLSSSGDRKAVPWSFMSGFSNGTIIAWQVQAKTYTATVAGKQYGPYTSGWSGTCYFAVYPSAVAGPAVTANFSQGTAQAINNSVSFTISQSAGAAASDFVWALDSGAPTGSHIPSAQECTTTGSTAACSQIVNGTATLTITVVSPGPHLLNVYEINNQNVVSQTSQDLYGTNNYTFTGAPDPNDQYTSYSSLAANFTAALAAAKPYDNTLVSQANETGCGSGGGDGSGDYLDALQLSNAGWTGGQQVTVDGASFTLPSYGSCGADNLLAARQTLGAGGASGNALVFLATSTDAAVGVSGLMTGSPDSDVPSDYTAPAVPGGTAVTGSGCLEAQSFGAPCVAATGQVNYATATGCPSSTTYTLTAPDWVSGPSDIQATGVTDRVTPSGLQANSPKIFAFAVPVDGSCQVTSVTLPDVGAMVLTTPAGSVSLVLPALHIFGMALRNTTTATPTVAASQPSPSGQAWTGAFESPVEDAFGSPPGYTISDQTMRISVATNISAPVGAQIRIRLSDPGFLASDGTGPLHIGAVSIANQYYLEIPAQTPVALKFGGAASVVIPVGGDVYSDPLTLPFAVTAGHPLLVSIYLQNVAPPALPTNTFPSGAVTVFGASASPYAPDETMDTTGSPFNANPGSLVSGSVPLLSGIDITTNAATLNGPNGSVSSPGAPTVVVAGDNVIDGWTSSAQSDSLNAPSQRLAGQLMSQNRMPGYGLVDAGIASNQLVTDAAPGGVSLVARLDRDILAEPDVGTVVIDQGLEDVLLSASDQGSNCGPGSQTCPVVNAYTALTAQLNAFGVNVVIANLTPCGGYSNATTMDTCTGNVNPTDSARLFINDQILSGLSVVPYCLADLDSAVSAGGSPEALQSADATSDKVNLSWAGYQALAPAVPADVACLGPANDPLPPPS